MSQAGVVEVAVVVVVAVVVAVVDVVVDVADAWCCQQVLLRFIIREVMIQMMISSSSSSALWGLWGWISWWLLMQLLFSVCRMFSTTRATSRQICAWPFRWNVLLVFFFMQSFYKLHITRFQLMVPLPSQRSHHNNSQSIMTLRSLWVSTGRLRQWTWSLEGMMCQWPMRTGLKTFLIIPPEHIANQT